MAEKVLLFFVNLPSDLETIYEFNFTQVLLSPFLGGPPICFLPGH